MTKTQQLVNEAFPELKPKFDVSLSSFTYFKIGGRAEILIEVKNSQELVKLVKFCREKNLSYHILGGASNVLISDEGLQGIVIRVMNEKEYDVVGQPDINGKQLVRVGAGYKTALFVRKTVDDGFVGLEYFLGVPGTIGGAIYNNAHYLEHLIGEHVHAVEVLNTQNEIVWLPARECRFAYDFSRFHNSGEVILRVEFALARGDKENSLELIKTATILRAKTQPLGEPSSGCYFRNTPNTPKLQILFPQFADRREVPAGFLIDQAGLKKKSVGGIQVSEKHAAFLVNTGSGTSTEVQELANIVKERVKSKYGVELQEEVFWMK